jgi:hypothetical protein
MLKKAPSAATLYDSSKLCSPRIIFSLTAPSIISIAPVFYAAGAFTQHPENFSAIQTRRESHRTSIRVLRDGSFDRSIFGITVFPCDLNTVLNCSSSLSTAAGPILMSASADGQFGIGRSR